MRFLSVCSGIEAASAAWEPLGWQPVAYSEIEPFPCSVLAHHHPHVPNWGDMTKYKDWPNEPIDLLCGGTPCQSFSVAGLRKGLADPRGNLMLTFGAIAAKYRPRWLVWENVPGVLSSNGGRDFGTFLGLLAELGYGFAYRVLDAQYVRVESHPRAVPQRRRRVFVVGHSGGQWQRAAAVLFERESLCGYPPPRRKAGKVAPTIPSRSSAGGGLGTDFDCDGGLIQAYGGNNQSGPIDVATARNACASASGRMDFETETFLVAPVGVTIHGTDPTVQKVASYDEVAQCLRARTPGNIDNSSTTVVQQPVAYGIRTANTSSNGWGIQEEVTHTLDCAQGVAVAQPVSFAIQAGALRTNPASGPGGIGVQADHAYTLEARAEVQAVAFAENSRAELRLEGGDGSRCGAISTGGGKPGQGVPMVLQCSLPETLYNKGFNALEEGNASTQETYPGTLLRTLRQEAGEEAFAQWGLGILDSLQQAEVLRQALHGIGIRPAALSRSWVVYCALSRPESRSGWLLQSLREAGCERCASQGWEPSEQLAGELGAYLSELSQPGAQAARFLHDLWQASQGLGVLRQALSAVQEVGRPTHGQRKPVHAGAEGFGASGAEGLQGAGLHREIPRDGVLQQACAASEAGNSGCSATEQERGGQSRLGQTPFAVRRLTCEEAEFLQGFPRGYTAIPWRNKPASECPDGPRYKSLGNSWAINCARWIGERIEAVDQIIGERE